jgi:cardiolipin synthase
LSSAYFVPDEGTIEALVQAARRGVKVEIITPGEHNDSASVKAASPALWGRLLENGVAIYRYDPTMFHCKVLVLDDFFSSVGSTNFDNRSFRLNDEVNLNVFDAGSSRRQAEIFEADKRRSELVTLEQWERRPLREKTKNWLVALFRREL